MTGGEAGDAAEKWRKRFNKLNLKVQRMAKRIKEGQTEDQQDGEGRKETEDVLDDEFEWSDEEDGLSHKHMRYEKKKSMVT